MFLNNSKLKLKVYMKMLNVLKKRPIEHFKRIYLRYIDKIIHFVSKIQIYL
jgi:hypothetical protein